ncbi:MAG: DNA-binding protein, partial [Cytophagaceae bacterium]
MTFSRSLRTATLAACLLPALAHAHAPAPGLQSAPAPTARPAAKNAPTTRIDPT